jgi:hypothetical protein
VLRIGLVIEIFDPRTEPKKPKWHICICDSRGLFLRINSKPLWPPHYQLLADRNDFLDHDSYVELRQLCGFSHNAVVAAMRRPRNPLGSLTKEEALRLAMSARRAVTLSEEHKDLIWNNLTSAGYR